MTKASPVMAKVWWSPMRSTLQPITGPSTKKDARKSRLLIESSEAHPDWLIHYPGHQARTAGTLTLYRAALRDLDRLREAPARASSPVS